MSGALLLGGGALSDDNTVVWKALYKAALQAIGYEGSATQRPQIAVFCSAAPNLKAARIAYEEHSGKHLGYRQLFEQYGFKPVWIPLAADVYGKFHEDCAPWIETVRTSQAVWFNGGNQALHARCLLRDDGSDTLLLAAVRGLYARGGVVAGSSAGAAVQGHWTYGEGTVSGYLAAGILERRKIASASLVAAAGDGRGGFMEGLGFCPSGVIVDTHFEAWSRFGRLPPAIGTLGARFGLGIDEDTAMLLRGSRGTVLGRSGVTVFDARDAGFDKIGDAFAARGLIVHCLRSGDTINLDTGDSITVQPLMSIDGNRRENNDAHNLLLPGNARELIQKLLLSERDPTNGYISEGGRTFLFQFTRTTNTHSDRRPIAINLDISAI